MNDNANIKARAKIMWYFKPRIERKKSRYRSTFLVRFISHNFSTRWIFANEFDFFSPLTKIMGKSPLFSSQVLCLVETKKTEFGKYDVIANYHLRNRRSPVQTMSSGQLLRAALILISMTLCTSRLFLSGEKCHGVHELISACFLWCSFFLRNSFYLAQKLF